MTRLILYAVASIVVLCGATFPAPCELTDSLEASLRDILDRNLRSHDVRGVSAAVVFPDGTLWTGAGGVSHGTVPMEPSMLFGIGSVTKSFVAALVLELVEGAAVSRSE